MVLLIYFDDCVQAKKYNRKINIDYFNFFFGNYKATEIYIFMQVIEIHTIFKIFVLQLIWPKKFEINCFYQRP